MTTRTGPAYDLVALSRSVAVAADDAELATSIHKVVLWCSKWASYAPTHELRWELRRLSRSERNNVPTDGGVYTLLVQPGIAGHPASSFLMYVGKASSLRRRFGEYLNQERRSKGRPKIYRALIRYSDQLWFCYAPLPGLDSATLEEVEDALIVAFMPAWNDKLPAQVRSVVEAFR